MSFSRLKYDDCTYKHNLRESISVGDYMTTAWPFACQDCFVPDMPLDKLNQVECKEHIIDINSELLGITRKASSCPLQKYLPKDDGYPYCVASKNVNICKELVSESTLISNPKATLRETGWNFPFTYLCKNPQEKALIEFDHMINNRIVVKDNHRPCLPRPISQDPSLPPKENENLEFQFNTKWDDKYFYDVTSPQLGLCKK